MLATLVMALNVPIIIAHRGASAERPEHTLAAYELAIEQGANFIEPDLVITKDGILVARHENEISGTTDVPNHPEFADRKATKTIDGEKLTGWFTEDFTLAELKTLRAKERLPQVRKENRKYDGQFSIPTFAEVCALAKAKGVGVYPETKHPSYFRNLGLPLEPGLLKDLTAIGWTKKSDPVFIQSFEVNNLKELRPQTALKLVQLIDASGKSADGFSFADMITPAGLKEVAKYANGIGPSKDLVIPRKDNAMAAPTSLVKDAHAAGLVVHPWTFRPELFFLPKQTSYAEELAKFLAAGVDGFFTDSPRLSKPVVDAFK